MFIEWIVAHVHASPDGLGYDPDQGEFVVLFQVAA